MKASLRGLELHLQLAEDIPATTVTEANRLKQILLNLMGNALKFTFHGSITLKVNMEGEFIKFAVIDTGIGIREE